MTSPSPSLLDYPTHGRAALSDADAGAGSGRAAAAAISADAYHLERADAVAAPAEPAGDGMVFVVDEDRAICDAIGSLLSAAGHFVRTFYSGLEFLEHARPDTRSCLVVQAGMRGMDGLTLQRRLHCSQAEPAVVFTADGGVDVATAVSAMKAGAVDVLTRPFSPQHLLAAVATGLERSHRRRESRVGVLAVSQRYAGLTPRERQVMALVTDGLMNKQVASELNLSVISVKIHRGNLMKKMGVRTLPDLVRAAGLLKLQ